MAVKIKFLGGVRTVTGSSHLVSTDKSEILIDAGLFQGRRQEFYQINTTFHYNPRTLDALILSHAHIDHCGNIPSVIKNGLRSNIYTTSATKDLCKVMLEDSGKIQEEDVKYVNKINRRLGQPLVKPLYTRKEASAATRRFRSISYDQKFCIAKDAYVTLYDSGHILGSSIVVLDLKDGDKNVRVGYAVDLYKEGYAAHLIFSSGYTYAIKEVDIMKALSVSMGVPASAIILENRSGYTYEFVKNTKDILDRNGWRSALLVSSPYHMRRALFVFNKIAKDIKVTCTPVADSLYYTRPDRDLYGRKNWKRIKVLSLTRKQ